MRSSTSGRIVAQGFTEWINVARTNSASVKPAFLAAASRAFRCTGCSRTVRVVALLAPLGSLGRPGLFLFAAILKTYHRFWSLRRLRKTTSPTSPIAAIGNVPGSGTTNGIKPRGRGC